MVEPAVPSTCTNPDCNAGYVAGELCPVCFGTGAVPLRGVYAHIAKKVKSTKNGIDSVVVAINDVADKVNDIKEKVDEIKDVVDAL